MTESESVPVEWPPEDLENLGFCPICGSESRSLSHKHMRDLTFFTPGLWTLWSCKDCNSSYLDPRPTRSSIARAYSNYYTHEEPETVETPTGVRRIKSILSNGYKNSRYGTSLKPSSFIGSGIAAIVPILKRGPDIEYRYLPRARAGDRLLDVGCGNGSWLKVARRAQWDVAGTDPDPAARDLAGKDGIVVKPNLANWSSQASQFAAVTLNHVIEHVHDPVETLKECAALLRPGGMLFVETPNVDAFGHALFGADWRGLEPPRHLALFNRESLESVLERAGFSNIRFRPRPTPFPFIEFESRKIENERRHLDGCQDAPVEIGRAKLLRAMFWKRHSEFLTVTAIKSQ